MSIDRDQVEWVARLAKLDLEEDEIERFRDELGDILEYVEKLDELDTSEVEPTTHAVLTRMLGRDDDTEEGLPREEVLKNAPEHRDGEFKVPKIVD